MYDDTVEVLIHILAEQRKKRDALRQSITEQEIDLEAIDMIIFSMESSIAKLRS